MNRALSLENLGEAVPRRCCSDKVEVSVSTQLGAAQEAKGTTRNTRWKKLKYISYLYIIIWIEYAAGKYTYIYIIII
ncbi:MAG: hypothetical protein MJE68_27435 [Proteobacteria bacterium]|nr:hypothetical protein [Pseudomonadota bacterium]